VSRRDVQTQAANEKVARLAAVKPWGDVYAAFALAAHLATEAIDLQRRYQFPAPWEDWKNFSATLQSFFTCVGILAGGIWAYTRYVRQEENNPYIEFSADLNFIGRQSESWIIEIIGLIENKGKVQHQMTEFQFELDAIYAGDPTELGPSKWQQEAYFGHSVARGSFLSKERQFFFIAPTVKAKYSHITLVPMEQWRQSSFFCIARSNTQIL
jgi:hypothetical protein